MTPRYSTRSGQSLNLFRIRSSQFLIEDIAHHLALINRFNGATQQPISVAQHSIFVSMLVPREHALQGLLHDASEAYLGDVTKWLKSTEMFQPYRRLEERFQRSIFKKFGVPTRQHRSVEQADRLMVRYEAHRGGVRIGVDGYDPPTEAECQVIEALTYEWSFWPWEVAEARFTSWFQRLRGHQK